MVDISTGYGTFIPNSGDYPRALTLDPSERAKFLAEKAASQQQAREAAQQEEARKSNAPKDDEEKGVRNTEDEFAPAVSNLGKNLNIDV